MIRQFAYKDARAVFEIETEAFPKHDPWALLVFYGNVGECFMVAEQEGNVVGYIVGCRQTDTVGGILSVGVLKKYQGQGIGSELILAICDTIP